MLKQIITFIKECPELANKALMPDFLGDEPGAVSVQGLACDPVIHQYADGGSLRQYMFEVLLREEIYAAEDMAPESFFETVTAWLSRDVPLLATGQTAQRFEVVKSGALADRDYSGTCYGMVCRLIYYQRGE